MKEQTSFTNRYLSLFLCFCMLLTYLPVFLMGTAAADATTALVVDNKKADPSTIDWENYFGPDKMDTEFAGGVWTDKSVFTGPTSELPGVTLTDDDHFLVALSAIASNLAITGHTSAPTDTMLVLDMSGSMVDGTYEVGTIRQGNNYQTVDGIDMSLIDAMIEATNSTIEKLMKQNTNNRVGVVLYSGNSATNQAATPGTATVILPLGRYAGVEGEYLSVDTTYRTEALYAYSNRRWQATGKSATYVPEGTSVYVSVKNGLTTEAGGRVNDTSKQANGGTYIQNGLYQAMNQFLAVTDTTVPDGKSQAGAERMPVLVLMTDGAPTIATTSYYSIGNSNTGDGSATNDRITFLTQLTAAYVRGNVAAKYQENASDEKEMLFLTLGLGTENSSAATHTLYPVGSNSTLVGYWNTYLNAGSNTNVNFGSGNNRFSVTRQSAVEAMNYVDKYYYANDAQGLINSFEEIVGEIELKAESYATLIEGGNANFSGYVTFEDALGEMMHVADMKGLFMSDGKGGKVLYTGKGIAESMTAGNLGTVDDPNERGDELVATVKERIPGTSTTQAQQLIANAYADMQLYYADDNNWSNYIGWYADQDGNYVGFWDKDSGYENAPEGAVYANRSYGYLGVNDDSDMMHVVVMVRTELATLHQTVLFKIPASLLPLVQYKVTLDEDDPNVVEAFEREDAIPMQLVFEVGLRPDINPVNLEKKIAEHVAKGGHVHRNDDGTVTFYTNEWAIGNDKNGNGIPDPDEVETAAVAESHFHPALDNSRYYYTEDTPVLDKNGDPVKGSARPVGEYFHRRYIYNQNERFTVMQPIAADTLANKAQYDREADQWYIPAGTIFRDVARYAVNKTQNVTGTLSYSAFPAVFENGNKQDVYAFLGNNGSFTMAPAQGIALTKTIAEVSEDPNAPTEFTFTVTLSKAVDDLMFTDTDGNALTGVATVNGDTITVTLKAGQTVVISGIPTGTAYTVEEENTRYYNASSVNADGTVAANTVHAVDFVNTAKGYGSLLVSKAVNYPQGFVPGNAHNNKTFTVQVVFTGDITGIVAPRNAVQSGNTFTLALKDGQSAVFANIPEDVTYTVTENDLSGGYELQELRYSDANKTIDGKDTDEVHVVNRYTLQSVQPKVKVRGDKTLVTNETNWGGEEFTVELLRIDHFADEEPESTGLTATMTEAAPYYEIDLSSVTFSAAGTYYFRVVELIPEDRNENIAYDRTFGLFSITVGDADADGSLEIQAVNAYQTTTVSGNGTDGWILEKDFTNVVTTDRIYLDIQKHVVDAEDQQAVNAHLGDITFGLFTAMTDGLTPSYYALTNTKGEATIMIPVTKEFIEDEGTNGSLTFYMREIAPAVANRVLGMNYDESWIYAVTITWDELNNKAVVQYAPIENGEIGTYADYIDGSVTFEHTNTYEKNVDLDIDLSGSKTLNGGNDLGGREFTFDLYESTAAFVLGDLIKSVKNNGNAISFDDITFNAPGLYYMVAKEGASALGGITVDTTEYHITVAVEKFSDTDGTTRLRLVQGYPTVVRYGTSENVGADGLDFNNTYTVIGSDDVTIGGTKLLAGRAPVAGEFTIGLYSDSECTDLIESASNLANGSFAFSPITYTANDLGDHYAEKTYTYYIKELPGNKGGVTYEDKVHIVTVKVSHKDGELVVTPSDNFATLEINNSYKAAPVDVLLNGRKELFGDWSNVTNKDFTFQLFKADSGFAITDQTPEKSETVTGNADFGMKLHYEDGEEGFYYYVLKELIPEQKAGGVGYDAGEYHITVNVADPGDGHLVARVSMYRPGTGNTSTAVFTNAYTVMPTEITLEGSKSYINSITEAPMNMDENMFSFLVLEGENLAATGYNLADGSIKFTPIRYTSAGVHTYSIVELLGDAGGIEYDDTVFTVKVTVKDNGDGTLTATADYAAPVKFQNTYTHRSAQVTINGIKELSGDWSAVPEASKLFNFELYETDSTFTISDDAVDFVTGEAGEFSFGTLTYFTEGTHYYVITERSGESGKGISYSDAKYRITVKVEDDGNGNLIPEVTAEESNVTVTPDADNIRLVTVDGLKFINTYTTKPAQYTPSAQKLYERDETEEMKEFDFILTVDGENEQKKQNDSQGRIDFDTLYFDAVGTYELKIREQDNILWGLIRWDRNVYTVTLHVEDDGAGQLFVNEDKTEIVGEKGRDDLVFRNAHHDVITKKDVFLLSEPDISIDGKTVEKNDILTYVIYYTNYDSVPVDIEITDSIPQYTTYVPGSADNGGTLTDNTISWTLEDVAPDHTVAVSFQVKVAETEVTIVNDATVLEGENKYYTNKVENFVEEDTLTKDVFHVSEPAVSVDGKAVEKNDILIYEITYTNSDDFAADVTITDAIPQYTTYVEGSADNGAVFADGVLTWNLKLAAGESKTVSFMVKVAENNATITNQATALEGENKLETNQVRTPVDEDLVTKDVFAVNEPDVSIDGKTVEKGDVLLYAITYTNFDGLAADVTITDAIPQYTTYVEGSADNGAVFADGVLTWNLKLAAGESKTVSFEVKVTDANVTITNQATALEGENKLESNQVSTSSSDDTVVKDVFYASAPTVSIDGKTVEKDDVLLYTITYTNSDDFAANVIITDAIPQYTAYVEGSADNGAVFADGVLTWNLRLAAGESKTVSFEVKVTDDNVTFTNQATALEGENKLETNVVTNRTPAPLPDIPQTGDYTNMTLWWILLIASAAGIHIVCTEQKKRKAAKQSAY